MNAPFFALVRRAIAAESKGVPSAGDSSVGLYTSTHCEDNGPCSCFFFRSRFDFL